MQKQLVSDQVIPRLIILLFPYSPDFLETADVNWPKCVISKCLVLPSINGFTKAANGPVEVGKDAKYECISNGQVSLWAAFLLLFDLLQKAMNLKPFFAINDKKKG